MKFLGIDFGTKRIGLAISDDGSTFAFPREILPNDANIFQKLGEIIKKENIKEIVIGDSIDFSGKPNPVSGQIEFFISELTTRFSLVVHKQKEFLTSVEARKSPNMKSERNLSQASTRLKEVKSGRVDAGAAALILQRYLDKKNKALGN